MKKKKRHLSEHSCPAEKLSTPWTASVTAENVWKEYPRPAMARKGWINLNGLWDYAFTGRPEAPEAFDGRILVPFSPESPLSGVNRQLQPKEYLWYRRQVTVRRPAEGRRLLLHFGAVDQNCIVYINGKEAGVHSGGYLPFCLDITPVLPAACPEQTDARSFTFELLIRVQDRSDTSWQSRGKQKLKRGGMFYTAQSGIWQTVWLEEVPSVHISSVLAVPDFDHARCRLLVQVTDARDGDGQNGRAGAAAQSSRPDVAAQNGRADTAAQNGSAVAAAAGYAVTVRIRPETEADRLFRDGPGSLPESGAESAPGAPVSAPLTEVSTEAFTGEPDILLSFPAGEEASVSLPDFHPWTPEDPFLYHLTVQAGQDRVECYFAMRKCDVQTAPDGLRRIFLNNRPCFQAGVLDQGYWPDGLYTAPCDEAFVFDITAMKKLGFNLLRKHVKIEPQRWYYHCDRLGMLVWQDMVCGGTSYQHWFVTYLATLINACSITVPDGKLSRPFLSRQSREGRLDFLREMEETVRTLRIHPCIVCWVPFNEGWGQFDAADAAGRIARLDPDRLIDHASGWFDQGAGDISSIHFYFFSLRVRPEPVRALALTEFGGYSRQIPEHSFGRKLYGYGKYQDEISLTKGYETLLTDTVLPAVRKGVSASIYTQLSDIEDEVNGLFTYDRKVEKMDADTVRRLNKALRTAGENSWRSDG